MTSPTDSPSVAQIEERLAARERLRAAEGTLASAYSVLEEVNRSARAMVTLQQQLRALRGDENEKDRAIIRRLSRRFTEALSRFGLRSLPVEEVTIGEDTLLPEHDGFELSFDIRHGLSASDTIRAKWAHYVAMAATAASEENGSSLGILILDEPRQQEAEFSSVRALYAELADVARSTQVIVASSADDHDMAQLLEGLDVNLIANVGTHMFSGGISLTA
jgi:predicted ATPase